MMRNVILISLVIFSILLAACVMPGAKPPSSTPVVVEQPANTTPAPPAPDETNSTMAANETNGTIAAPPGRPGSECLSAQNILQRDQCFSDLASSARDVKMCDQIYSIAVRDGCLNRFAAQNERICAQLNDATLKQNCFYAAAMRLNDTQYCTPIGDEARRTECLKALSPPCSFEKDDASTTLCRALNKKDYTLCKSNQCLFNYAIKAGDIGACGIISGESALAGACQAAVKNESNYCGALAQQSIQDYCDELTAYALNDSFWCGRASEGSDYRNRCYLTFAINQSNASFCAPVWPETARDECYIGYANARNDPSVCPKVINSLNRNKCMISTALKNANPAACNGLPYYDKRNCYNLVVSGTTPIYSSFSCALVDDSLWQAKCYTAAAQQAMDSTICQKIDDATAKADCLSKFS
ncbi:MAG: hypothetical protein V1728_01060 [Candidatus Micrarchaeota archaeon]